uniref:RRM domain-containing protein n=1 Tax=Steinernema glaseri TaxID=37863 RepID=A0A1I8AF11_9BILA
MSALELNREMAESVDAIETLSERNPLTNVMKLHLEEIKKCIERQRQVLERGGSVSASSSAASVAPEDQEDEPSAAPTGREHLPNQLIIKGLSEDKDDDEFVRNLLEKADRPSCLDCTVSRVGKADPQIKRYMLLAFESQVEAYGILQTLQSKGLIDSLGKGVSISRDMDREEQEKENIARKKVAAQNKEYKGTNTRYYYDRITFDVVRYMC